VGTFSLQAGHLICIFFFNFQKLKMFNFEDLLPLGSQDDGGFGNYGIEQLPQPQPHSHCDGCAEKQQTIDDLHRQLGLLRDSLFQSANKIGTIIPPHQLASIQTTRNNSQPQSQVPLKSPNIDLQAININSVISQIPSSAKISDYKLSVPANLELEGFFKQQTAMTIVKEAKEMLQHLLDEVIKPPHQYSNLSAMTTPQLQVALSRLFIRLKNWKNNHKLPSSNSKTKPAEPLMSSIIVVLLIYFFRNRQL
jgi:hypothetical protein